MAGTSIKKKSVKLELSQSKRNEILMGIQVVEARERLDQIAKIIEQVDNRCMAADGPVTQTLREMTQEEIKEIYDLSQAHRKAGKPIQVYVSQELYSNQPPIKRQGMKGKLWYVHLKRGVQRFRLDYSGTEEECEWMAHMLRTALAGGEIQNQASMDLQNAAMLIRRLMHRIVCDNPALPRPSIWTQSNNWLQRKGLQGSVLRG